MSNAERTVPLDLMIRRLEEANAHAHERGARPDEQASETQQDAAPHSSDQPKAPAVPHRRSSRRGLALGLIGSLLAAVLGGVAFVWQPSYFDAAKLIVARWVSLDQTSRQAVAPIAGKVSSELEQHLQAMAHDLASLAQQIEQLKTSEEQTARDNAAVGEQLKAALLQMTRDNTAVGALQVALAQITHDNAVVAEQLKTALSQMTRDNAAVGALKVALAQITHDNAVVAEQLKTALSQITRDNAAVVEQLKATQEQTVRLLATRARRKPVPTPPQAQAQPQAAVYSPPRRQ